MNYDGNSQSSKIQSVNVHDRDTTLDMNTNFRSNTDLGYAGMNRQVSFIFKINFIYLICQSLYCLLYFRVSAI